MAVYELKGDFGTDQHPLSGDLKIAHLNANGLWSKLDPDQNKDDENIAASIQRYDVFAITETKLVGSQESDIRRDHIPAGYTLTPVESRVKGRGGGVAIFVKDCWIYEVVRRFSYNLNDRYEPVKDAGGAHPCQFVHIVIKQYQSQPDKEPIDLLHTHIVAVYLPGLAPRKEKTLLDLLGNQLKNYSNIVVLGDINLDQFDYEPAEKNSDMTIDIWKLGYAQVISNFTREKDPSALNWRNGTIIDHIYVKYTSMSTTALPDLFFEKCLQQIDAVKRTETVEDMMKDRKKMQEKSSSYMGTEDEVLKEKYKDEYDKAATNLGYYLYAIKDSKEMKTFEISRNKIRVKFEELKLASGVVREPTRSDHGLVYCVLPKNFYLVSEETDEYRKLIRSGGWNHAEAKQELRSITTQLVTLLLTSPPSQQSISLNFDTDKVNPRVLFPMIDTNSIKWSEELLQTRKQTTLFGRTVFFLDNRCPELELLWRAYMRDRDSYANSRDKAIDPNWWIASPCSSFLVLPLHDHLVTSRADVKDMKQQNSDREYHYILRKLAVAAVDGKSNDLPLIHSYIRFVVSHYVQPKLCRVEYNGKYAVLHFEVERPSKVRLQMECLGALIKER